jgi:catechol 2,3-dioxygenase-like lactoylglutathione lyase family enzyme
VIKGIDHIVILVNDLQQASEDYRALGFTVTPGGEHTGGETHNALIPFADGSYFELIAFKREAPGHRWWRHAATGEGLIDFALLPDDAADTIAAARARGLEISGPFDGGRLRPDGQEVRWQNGAPGAPGLPFLCADVTARELRVPTGAAREHPNGVIGVDGITVAVADVDVAAEHYAALIGIPMPPVAHIAPLGLSIAIVELDPDAIALAQPASPSSPLHAHLMARGPGIYSVALLTKHAPPEAWPSFELAHGARLELHQE